jgi:amino acid transporter
MAEATGSLQEKVDEQEQTKRQKFGTFAGVFTPTLLTVLGVIMYLREGWVVGNAGLLGAWLIILLAFTITACTGLSMSSITTNIRIGAGGAYSIIAQSLGIEVGGSLGIPLYVSQALAVTMYIFGFREGWLYIFPNHPPLAVDIATFALLFGIAYISTSFAFRIQYVIMAIIAVSLISIFGTFFTAIELQPVTWWGTFPGAPETNFQGANFWIVFAVFFPAATGIMAGANMSGDLENPRRAIPLGTMSAIGISLVIYMALAYWLATMATMAELSSVYTIMIDKALWGPIVLAGLLGATFSSGLSSLVGAPRILQALGENDILPAGKWLAQVTPKGEPRKAMWLTGGIVLAALFLRDLNAIAPLITMFFLITYAMINVVVLIEQSLGLISFRPILKVPRIVPLIGALGCFFAMFIINSTFSLIALFIVIVFYGILIKRQLANPFQDVRSGLFVSLAEWAAKRVAELPTAQERAWRPNLLIPVEYPSDMRGTFNFVRDITNPKGSVKLIGLANETLNNIELLDNTLPQLAQDFREEGIYSSATIIDAEEYGRGVLSGMQSLSGAFFRPNVLFLTLPPQTDEEREADLKMIISRAKQSRLGVLLFAEHSRARLGRRHNINIWSRDQSPNWHLSMELGNLDLAILVSYQINRDWHGKIKMVSAIREAENVEAANQYLTNLINLARIPDADVLVGHSDLDSFIQNTPQADLNVFGLPDDIDFDFVRRMVEQTSSTCIFIRDSGDENALA